MCLSGLWHRWNKQEDYCRLVTSNVLLPQEKYILSISGPSTALSKISTLTKKRCKGILNKTSAKFLFIMQDWRQSSTSFSMGYNLIIYSGQWLIKRTQDHFRASSGLLHKLGYGTPILLWPQKLVARRKKSTVATSVSPASTLDSWIMYTLIILAYTPWEWIYTTGNGKKGIQTLSHLTVVCFCNRI